MAEFVEVAQLEQIAPGNSKLVYVGEQSIALFNIDGMIYVIDDSCLHQGSSLEAQRQDPHLSRTRVEVRRNDWFLNPQSRKSGRVVPRKDHRWQHHAGHRQESVSRRAAEPGGRRAQFPRLRDHRKEGIGATVYDGQCMADGSFRGRLSLQSALEIRGGVM